LGLLTDAPESARLNVADIGKVWAQVMPAPEGAIFASAPIAVHGWEFRFEVKRIIEQALPLECVLALTAVGTELLTPQSSTCGALSHRWGELVPCEHGDGTIPAAVVKIPDLVTENGHWKMDDECLPPEMIYSTHF
jgi:hypothetical protein